MIVATAKEADKNRVRRISNTFTSRPRGYKTFIMLNSTEQKIFRAENVKVPTIVGILTFMNRKNSILGLSEP